MFEDDAEMNEFLDSVEAMMNSKNEEMARKRYDDLFVEFVIERRQHREAKDAWTWPLVSTFEFYVATKWAIEYNRLLSFQYLFDNHFDRHVTSNSNMVERVEQHLNADMTAYVREKLSYNEPPFFDFDDDKALLDQLEFAAKETDSLKAGIGFRFRGCADAFIWPRAIRTHQHENLYHRLVNAIQRFSKERVVRLLKSLITRYLEAFAAHGVYDYQVRWLCEFLISQGVYDEFFKSAKGIVVPSDEWPRIWRSEGDAKLPE